MDKLQAMNLIKSTFNSGFDKSKYRNFIINLLDGIDETKEFTCGNAYVPESFANYVTSYGRIGKYTDSKDASIEVLWVKLKPETSLERARTVQRNFIAWYLNGGRGAEIRDNALVAFYNETVSDWRFSFVKLDVALKQDDKGKVKIINEFTPAKRYSFLVGEQEPNHTAQSRLINYLIKDYPTVDEIEEAFNVEKVSKEFFANYKELFLQLVDNLKAIRENEPSQRINTEFTMKSIKESDFCKKLLGQLVFLYFIQKKGWLGVSVHSNWGEGDKQFLRHTFERAVKEGKNFFNDYLEPLFYDALANGERDNNYFSLLDCKIPFLNGGLFETIGGYDWVNTDIVFENEIFSNSIKTKTGDVGTGILDVFDRYNFTVKEDEPLEKEVAVDPEMLGKVFEELLEVQDRKSKGAFYTPREIVHYMCQESLINYLCTELDAKDDKFITQESKQIALIEPNIKQLDFENLLTKQDISDFIHHSDKISQLESIATEKENTNSKYKHILSLAIKDNAERIDKALEDIKICDPAIGSGAFPVGMMNEIVRARIALVESGFLKPIKKRTIYEYKRQAIQNSIYGVDIESGAVEIAKLRLWLSLVVEEDDIENIKALPNLDYKIVCGNSLLSVERNLFNDTLFRQLEELKPQFFNETRKSEKKRLKKEIDAIIKELTKDGTFDFEIYFSEVFNEKGGFDIVIGNPPYIGQKGNKDLFNELKNSPYFENKMDYWYFFLHKAYNISNNIGITSYITPSYWTTASGSKKVRQKFAKKYTVIELINFNENKVFTAGVHTNLFILSKRIIDNNYCKCCIYENIYENDLISNKKNETVNIIKQDTILNSWTNFINFLPDNVHKIIMKLTNESEKLCDPDTIGESKKGVIAGKKITNGICNINPGIETGKDRLKNNVLNIDEGIYVLSEQELKTLNLTIEEQNKIKNFYKNSDIYKYCINESNKYYIIYVNDIEFECDFLKYNNLYSHFKKYKKELLSRAENGVLKSANKKGKWWALKTDRPNGNFNIANIVCPQRSRQNLFGYAEKGMLASADVFFISLNSDKYNLKYILSILNSSIGYYWLYWMGKRKGLLLELVAEPLQYIPIKKANEDIQNKFVSVVDKILAITQTDDYLENQEKQDAVKEYEKQIDIMVYKLYDLTYDEVLYIDKNFTMPENEYDCYEL